MVHTPSFTWSSALSMVQGDYRGPCVRCEPLGGLYIFRWCTGSVCAIKGPGMFAGLIRWLEGLFESC